MKDLLWTFYVLAIDKLDLDPNYPFPPTTLSSPTPLSLPTPPPPCHDCNFNWLATASTALTYLLF